MPSRKASPEAFPETQYISETDDSQNLWEAESILDERGPIATGEYFIKWKGIDQATGREFDPSWASKSGCTNSLIKDWKRLKKANPTIVGKAGMALQEKQKLAKRKRDSAGTGSGSRKKSKSRRASDAASPSSRKPRISTGSRTSSRFRTSLSASATPERDLGLSAPCPQTSMDPPARRDSLRPTTPPPEEEPVSPSSSRSAADVRKPLSKTASTASSDKPPRMVPLVEITISKKRDSDKPRKKVRMAGDEDDKHVDEVIPPAPQASPTQDGSVPADATADDVAIDTVMPDNVAGDNPAASSMTGDTITATQDVDEFGAASDANAKPGPGIVEDQPVEEAVAGPSGVDVQLEQVIINSPGSPPSAAFASKHIIDLSSKTSSHPGPDPSAKQNSARCRPIPQPSPSVFFPYLPQDSGFSSQTQTTRSVEICHIDPIGDFSSPLRPNIVTRVDGNGHPEREEEEVDVIVEASQLGHGVVMDVPTEPEPSLHHELFTEPEKVEKSAKVVERIIDGEVVYMTYTESMDESMDGEDSENGAGVEKQAGPDTTSQAEIQQKHIELSDEDMAQFDEPLPATDRGVRQTKGQGFEADEEAVNEVNQPVSDDDRAQVQDRDGTVANLEAKLAILEIRLKKATASIGNLTSDNEFLRQIYAQASDSAVEAINRAKDLEAQLVTLKGQLNLGLKQRGLHYDAINKQREVEVKKLRAQTKILLDQDRRTDDVVRRKAAQYGPMDDENRRLHVESTRHEDRIRALNFRNTQLLGQIEVLRARQIGVLGDEDDRTQHSESEAESSVHGVRDPAALGYATRPAGLTSSGNYYSATSAMIDDLKVELAPDAPAHLPNAGHHDEEVVEDGNQWSCKWRSETEGQCKISADTEEVGPTLLPGGIKVEDP